MAFDYQLEDTVFLPFTTRAFATGIPTVLAGTPAIDIYEDATATPIITGETLVVSLNSVVGFNMITVTATAASGFNVGGHYTAIIQAGTVGGVSVVGEVVAEFTIDASAAAVDLANGTDGLTVLKTGIDAIPTTAMRGTDGANTTAPDNAGISSNGTAIAALNDISAANVNGEVLDVLTVDVFAEVGQETPAATQSILKMTQYLYKFLRNKKTQTATELKIFADDASTVDHKATVSDDSTTATKGEIGTGP